MLGLRREHHLFDPVGDAKGQGILGRNHSFLGAQALEDIQLGRRAGGFLDVDFHVPRHVVIQAGQVLAQA